MRTTMDAAGRIVIPRQLREQVGLAPGRVEVVVDGAGVRIEPVGHNAIDEHNGLLSIPASGETMTDDDVAALRDIRG